MANKNLFKAPFLRTGLRMPDSNLGELGIEWKSRGRSEEATMVVAETVLVVVVIALVDSRGSGRRLYGNMIAR